MRVELDDAVDMAVKGVFPQGNTKVGKHVFRLRSLRNTNKLENGETGYFRHVIKGKDNRVFFKVKVKDKDAYHAAITRIQYRGLFGGSDTAIFGVDVTQVGQSGDPRLVVLQRLAVLTKKIAKKFQKRLVGKFEDEAAIIVDTIGARMAEEAL